MIIIELTDSTGKLTLPPLAPPLKTTPIEGAKDVQTLDNNISTYLTANKRQWGHIWPYMSEDDFNALKGYYDRQWTDYKYPLLTIGHYNIINVPVRMYLEAQNTIDYCGTVESVTVTFRETRQLP